jgi:hypothetical protein
MEGGDPPLQVLAKIDYLVDLHTASFGRVNSYYVRADMNSAITRHMSVLANPQIIVHNTGMYTRHPLSPLLPLPNLRLC